MYGFRKTMKGGSSVASSSDMTVSLIVRLGLRFLQIVMAATVAGLYGVDLDAARKAHKYADSKWTYAVVVATLSGLTAIVLAGLHKSAKAAFAFGWEFILFILWVALFGTFGKMSMHEDPEGNKGIKRMKHAVWVDLVNMLLWFISAVWSTVMFLKLRKERTTYTSRAEVYA